MRSLIILLMLPALMLIGCGQLESNSSTAENALAEMNANGSLSEEDVLSVDEGLLDEEFQMTEMSSSSVMMKLGGAELLIDFIDELSGDPEETAMIINGIEVTTEVVSNPDYFKGLIASLVTSQVEGVDVLGVPLPVLVNAGVQLVSGNAQKADYANLFGTLIRGALNMFLSKTPYGSLFGSILDGVTNGGNSNDNNNSNSNQSGSNNNANNNSGSNNNNNNQDSSSGSVLGGIVNAIGGIVGGSNPILGGVISLISNLFK